MYISAYETCRLKMMQRVINVNWSSVIVGQFLTISDFLLPLIFYWKCCAILFLWTFIIVNSDKSAKISDMPSCFLLASSVDTWDWFHHHFHISVSCMIFNILSQYVKLYSHTACTKHRYPSKAIHHLCLSLSYFKFDPIRRQCLVWSKPLTLHFPVVSPSHAWFPSPFSKMDTHCSLQYVII